MSVTMFHRVYKPQKAGYWLICWKGHGCKVINKRTTPTHYLQQERLMVKSLCVSSHIIFYVNASFHLSDIYWKFRGNTSVHLTK